MSEFWAGLDLGQAADYSALVVVQRRWEEGAWHYAVRHIKRYQLGTPYPQIVDGVIGTLQRGPLAHNTQLIIDGTGVGRSVVDLFRDQLGSSAVPVTITASGAPSLALDGYWHVAKRDLVGAVQVLLQTQRLKFAEDLPEVHLLVKELLNFQVKITAAAHDSYGAWREGQHDDLVLAAALAVWAGDHRDLSDTKHVLLPFIGGMRRKSQVRRSWWDN